MKMLLIRDNLFPLVEGTESEPATDSLASGMVYHSRRNKALTTIILSIDPSLLYIVGSDPSDPAEVWQKLRDTFQKKTWANKLRLKRRLYGMKSTPGGNLQSHFRAFTEIFDELSVLD